jgi:hypothetical protein
MIYLHYFLLAQQMGATRKVSRRQQDFVAKFTQLFVSFNCKKEYCPVQTDVYDFAPELGMEGWRWAQGYPATSKWTDILCFHGPKRLADDMKAALEKLYSGYKRRGLITDYKVQRKNYRI